MRSLVLLLAMAAAACAAPDATVLRQGAERQAQIRGQSRALVAQLDTLVSDYMRNALASGQDYTALRDIHGALAGLTDKEMTEVIDMLERTAPDAADSAGKKTAEIARRLRELALAHRRAQTLGEMAEAVGRLEQRQGANLGGAIDLKQLDAAQPSDAQRAALAAATHAQHEEQDGIAAETQSLAGKMAAAAGETPRYKDAAAQLEKIAARATEAASALAASRPGEAVKAETDAHERLAEVAHALLPEGADNNLAGQLGSLAQDQRALARTTGELGNQLKHLGADASPAGTDIAMYKQIARPVLPLAQQLARRGLTPTSPVDQVRNAPEMKSFLTGRAAGLEKKIAEVKQRLAALAPYQAALESKAQIVRDNAPAGQAAGQIDNALARMNDAQGALDRADATPANESQRMAATQLDAAATTAARSTAEQSRSTGPSHPGQLKNILDHLRDLETKAPATPEEFARQLTTLQQAAAAGDAPDAAQALKELADHMRDALRTIGGPGPQPAPDLRAAEQRLSQAAAAAGQKQQELDAVHDQLQTMKNVAAQQQRIVAEMAKAAGGLLRGTPSQLKQLASRQEANRHNAENVRTQQPDARGALAQADAAMAEAGEKLKTDAHDAAEPERAALDAVYKAQDALAGEAAQLARDLGEPEAPPITTAAGEIARAQADIGKAMAALPGNPRQAAAEFHQAESHAAHAAQPELPERARDAMREAQAAASEAAVAADMGHAGEARADSAHAGEAMATAQQALAQEQDGIGPLMAANEQPPAVGQASQTGGEPTQAGPGLPEGGRSDGSQPSHAAHGRSGANEKSWTDTNNGGKAVGATANHGETSRYLALPDRDRAALRQSQAEKYPQEYGPLIEAYMESLASDPGKN